MAGAFAIFGQIWEGYRVRGLYQEVVLITIDLAQVLVEKGERERAARLAAESFAINEEPVPVQGRALRLAHLSGCPCVGGTAPDDLFDRIGKYYRQHWVKPGGLWRD